MDDLRKNGSGYYDETAYKAIKNVSKNQIGGGTTMNGNFVEKDIVEVECTNAVRQFLLLACHDSYASALLLNDNEPRENAVEVTSRTVMYTDAGKLSYVYYDKVISYIKSVTDAEFTMIKQAVADTLKITEMFSEYPAGGVLQSREAAIPLSEANIEKFKEIMVEAVKTIAPIAAAPEMAEHERKAMEKKAVELQTERNVYKELYMDLLQNLKGDRA